MDFMCCVLVALTRLKDSNGALSEPDSGLSVLLRKCGIWFVWSMVLGQNKVRFETDGVGDEVGVVGVVGSETLTSGRR